MTEIKRKVGLIRGLNDDAYVVQRFVDDLEQRKQAIAKHVKEVEAALGEAQAQKNREKVFELRNAALREEKARELK